MPKQANDITFEDAMFETMFRWNFQWAAIIVKPIFHDGKLLHYIVKRVGESIFFIWQNEQGEWEELKKGSTERAKAAGLGIEYSCLF